MSNDMWNEESEQYVVASLFAEGNEHYENIKSILKPEDFYSKRNADIYRAVIETREAGGDLDSFIIADLVDDKNCAPIITYIDDLSRTLKSCPNAMTHSKRVVEESKVRETISACEKSIAKLRSGTGTASERLNYAINSVSSIDPDTGCGEVYSKSMKEVGEKWLDDYEEKVENPDKAAGLTLGVDGLDEIIGSRGVQPGDVVVIAARPKSFKTATMTKIVNHVGVELKKPVITFSMEMRDNLMFERSITQDSGVTGDNFYKIMEDDNYARAISSVGRLINTDMYIDDRSNLTLSQIRVEAREMSKRHGGYGSLGAIALDYFTLMDLEGNKNNPAYGYAQLSKGIVSLGKELGCPIFLLAQLNRNCESRPDKRPMPFDLGDTGQLERDASLIIMLYNEAVYEPESAMAGILELIIRVNRNGGTGTAYQTTKGGRLCDIDPSEIGRRIAEDEYQKSQSKNNKAY